MASVPKIKAFFPVALALMLSLMSSLPAAADPQGPAEPKNALLDKVPSASLGPGENDQADPDGASKGESAPEKFVPAPPAKPSDAAVAPTNIRGVYVRIITYGSAFKNEWGPEKHTAQDVLKIIGEIKPDVLNRFITGKKDPQLKVPVAPGQPEMTLAQFLTAAMRAGAPGCTIAPKVHLNEIWPDDYRMDAARSLRAMPITPALTMLDLDCWFKKKSNRVDNKKLLQSFRDMGWRDLTFNPGPYKSAHGYATCVMTYMSEKSWRVPSRKIEELKKHGIPVPLLHIDYPYQIKLFRALKPDRQAEILQQVQAAQAKEGFRFIYPVLMGEHYDSTRIFTSKNGPYHGASIYEVIKQLIAKDREEIAKAAAPKK